MQPCSLGDLITCGRGGRGSGAGGTGVGEWSSPGGRGVGQWAGPGGRG